MERVNFVNVGAEGIPQTLQELLPQDEADKEWGLTLVQEVAKNVAVVSDESLEAQMKYVSDPPVIKLSRKYQLAQGLAELEVRELAAGNSGVPEPSKRTSLKQLSSTLRLPDAVTALAARKAANKAAKQLAALQLI